MVHVQRYIKRHFNFAKRMKKKWKSSFKWTKKRKNVCCVFQKKVAWINIVLEKHCRNKVLNALCVVSIALYWLLFRFDSLIGYISQVLYIRAITILFSSRILGIKWYFNDDMWCHTGIFWVPVYKGTWWPLPF